ncbi:MAG: ABC transporter ATP-binding protein, partial [Planctomycetota bacterium]
MELKNLVKRFGDVVALDGVSIAVEKGEFCVLLGPSGCGKSTALRCVAGLETPDSGDVCIDGKRVNDLEPKDRDVAMVFQTYALYPHMTVAGNIGFPLKMRGLGAAEIESKVREAAKFLRI